MLQPQAVANLLDTGTPSVLPKSRGEATAHADFCDRLGDGASPTYTEIDTPQPQAARARRELVL